MSDTRETPEDRAARALFGWSTEPRPEEQIKRIADEIRQAERVAILLSMNGVAETLLGDRVKNPRIRAQLDAVIDNFRDEYVKHEYDGHDDGGSEKEGVSR